MSDLILLSLESCLPGDQAKCLSGAIKSFSITSLSVLAKIKDPMVKKLVEKVCREECFKDLEKEVLTAIVEAAVSSAQAQLDLVTLMGRERSTEELNVNQSKKCFEEDIEKFKERYGEIPPDLLPSRQFYEMVKKDPTKYFDLSKAMTQSDDSKSTTLSKLADALAERSREGDNLHEEKNSKVLHAAQWVKAITRLLVCVCLCSDLSLLSVLNYIHRIADLGWRYNWNVALLCDADIRKRIEKLVLSGKNVNECFVNESLTDSCVSKVMTLHAADSLKSKSTSTPQKSGVTSTSTFSNSFRGIRQIPSNRSHFVPTFNSNFFSSLSNPKREYSQSPANDSNFVTNGNQMNCFEWNDTGKCSKENCPFAAAHTAEKAGSWKGQSLMPKRVRK
jgi:hypothetical protein